MSEQEKVFVDGMIFRLPREGAPDFVKGSLAFSVEKMKAWLDQNKDDRGWVNVNLKVGRSGSEYAELDTWKPKDGEHLGDKIKEPSTVGNTSVPYPTETIDPDDVPF